jgi:hypothetical protein
MQLLILSEELNQLGPMSAKIVFCWRVFGANKGSKHLFRIFASKLLDLFHDVPVEMPTAKMVPGLWKQLLNGVRNGDIAVRDNDRWSFDQDVLSDGLERSKVRYLTLVCEKHRMAHELSAVVVINDNDIQHRTSGTSTNPSVQSLCSHDLISYLVTL